MKVPIVASIWVSASVVASCNCVKNHRKLAFAEYASVVSAYRVHVQE